MIRLRAAFERDVRALVHSALRGARQRARMDRQAFADAIDDMLGYGDLTEESVVAWERGRAMPPADILVAAMILAHASLSELELLALA